MQSYTNGLLSPQACTTILMDLQVIMFFFLQVPFDTVVVDLPSYCGCQFLRSVELCLRLVSNKIKSKLKIILELRLDMTMLRLDMLNLAGGE